jgi:hypothetical protein
MNNQGIDVEDLQKELMALREQTKTVAIPKIGDQAAEDYTMSMQKLDSQKQMLEAQATELTETKANIAGRKQELIQAGWIKEQDIGNRTEVEQKTISEPKDFVASWQRSKAFNRAYQRIEGERDSRQKAALRFVKQKEPLIKQGRITLTQPLREKMHNNSILFLNTANRRIGLKSRILSEERSMYSYFEGLFSKDIQTFLDKLGLILDDFSRGIEEKKAQEASVRSEIDTNIASIVKECSTILPALGKINRDNLDQQIQNFSQSIDEVKSRKQDLESQFNKRGSLVEKQENKARELTGQLEDARQTLNSLENSKIILTQQIKKEHLANQIADNRISLQTIQADKAALDRKVKTEEGVLRTIQAAKERLNEESRKYEDLKEWANELKNQFEQEITDADKKISEIVEEIDIAYDIFSKDKDKDVIENEIVKNIMPIILKMKKRHQIEYVSKYKNTGRGVHTDIETNT